MTVCIAGICTLGERPMVVMAADRMLTAADVQYEPERQSKFYHFNDAVGALIAGEAAPQIAICDATYRRVQHLDEERPTVQQIANIFREEHARYRMLEAEQVFLLPLGMNVNAFMQGQKNLNSKFVNDTVENLQNHSIGDTETIIAGVDPDLGGQLFKVNKWGVIKSDNLAGFSTAGIGEWHAASYLMQIKYEKSWDVNRALFHVFNAKRKAEAAPSVGHETDLYFIDEEGIKNFDPRIIELLEQHTKELEERMAPIAQRMFVEFDTKLTSLLQEKLSAVENAKAASDRIEGAAADEDAKLVAETWTWTDDIAVPKQSAKE